MDSMVRPGVVGFQFILVAFHFAVCFDLFEIVAVQYGNLKSLFTYLFLSLTHHHCTAISLHSFSFHFVPEQVLRIEGARNVLRGGKIVYRRRIQFVWLEDLCFQLFGLFGSYSRSNWTR